VLRLTLQTLKVAAIATMALLTLAFGQRFFTHYLDRAKAADTGPVLFTIDQDESADSVGQRLADLKLINSTVYFKAKLRLRGSTTQFQPGPHSLRAGMSVDEILNTITVVVVKEAGTPGTTDYVEFRIQEGWRLEQIAQLLVDKKLIKTTKEFFDALDDPSFNRFEFVKNRPPGATLEGYLFPDTYTVPATTSVVAVIDLMLDNFDRRVPKGMRDALPEGFTFQQVMILASIVEREAAIDSERPMIASVYYNRLRGIPPLPLQADPTVQYALGQEGNWWPELMPTDLQHESPYNTYRRSGLPPGPICTPSLKSIQAALNPAQSEYLYFVARGDGTHAFARTYEEHLQNVQKYTKP
jgi:peptidoglycan lytic transglycosylase G